MKRSTVHDLHSRVRLTGLALLSLTACDNLVGEGPATPYESDDSPARVIDDAGTKAPNVVPNSPANTPCAQAAIKAQTMLQSYCGSCHGADSTGKGGFKTVLDVAALISGGKVVPKQADASPLYKRISSGAMPPQEVAKRPSTADVQAIADWIGCGAPDWNVAAPAAYAFVSIDQRLSSILADVRSIPNPVDRQRMRYFDLSHLANAGASESELQTYREAVSFLINSLSRGRTVIAPKAVDSEQLLFRIDLRDYQWDAASWDRLEAIYPYAVRYDQDSRLFPYDEVSADQIRRETGTDIPVVQGDWFISHGSRPPLYEQLLNLPNNLAGLEAQLGVNVEADIASEQVLRAGFKNAGPSQNHRVIERHELSGNRGALWLSYDFSNNLDQKNIFAHPLDFKQDGGELIFNLENGLQGYFVINAAGQRLDKAPNNVVQDPLSRDGAVENGISCMGCHQQDGQLPKQDEIRSFVLASGLSVAETERVLALYVEADEMSAAFSDDQNRYRTARGQLGIQNLNERSFHSLDDTHQGVLDIDAVAGVLGIETASLIRALDASPGLFPQEIVTLRETGGGVQRDALEAVLPALLEGLGLGQPLRNGSSGNSSPLPRLDAGVGSNRDAGLRDAGVSDAGRRFR